MADRFVILNARDGVATALGDLPGGTPVGVNGGICLREAIPFGHKFAVCRIAAGEEILKHGEAIGTATRDIERGEHVHVHNLVSRRGRGDLCGEERMR